MTTQVKTYRLGYFTSGGDCVGNSVRGSGGVGGCGGSVARNRLLLLLMLATTQFRLSQLRSCGRQLAILLAIGPATHETIFQRHL